jgi:transcriptional regulator with XRE-family HTH domain
MTEIKTLLKNARKSRGLTLAQVEKDTGIPASTINTWERGASYPRGKNRDIIAEYYQLPKAAFDYAIVDPNTDSRAFDIKQITQDMAMSEYATKPVMLHKKHWEMGEAAMKKHGDVSWNHFFERLVVEAAGQSAGRK